MFPVASSLLPCGLFTPKWCVFVGFVDVLVLCLRLVVLADNTVFDFVVISM